MKQRYLPMTDKDRQEMLAAIGVNSVDELFSEIPESVRCKNKIQIPEALSEVALMRHMHELANKNLSLDNFISFLGAGVYEHYIPSVVGHVISRSEFYTAYTPYQPEISQGELQAIFEYQTMICELTGMEVANSSMYDGFTALAEAASMASVITKRQKILISRTVHPESREILNTFSQGLGLEIVELPDRDGITDFDKLKQFIDLDTACVIIQSPNFFGLIESLEEIEIVTHAHGALCVVSTNPISLGLLKPPGAFSADIVVGDAQPLGIAPSFGGPHCGFLATKDKFVRRVPGRLVGETVDQDGIRGYVLTLQAREQHIRRDKATSNICSNQALNALAAAVYMSSLGKQGIRDVASLNFHKAHYCAKLISSIEGIELVFNKQFFNEFVVKLNKPYNEVNTILLENGIIGGYHLGVSYPELENHMLIAVTEVRTKEDIEKFCSVLRGL